MSKSGILAQFVRSTILALLVSLAAHGMRQYSKAPDKAPSSDTCVDLAEFASNDTFQSLGHFYTFYLCEHSLPTTKLFHFIGTFNALNFISSFVTSGLNPLHLLFGVGQAYGFAWFSHFFLEANRPAALDYPFYSFASDFAMLFDLLSGSLTMW
jgi:hypothetical protein